MREVLARCRARVRSPKTEGKLRRTIRRVRVIMRPKAGGKPQRTGSCRLSSGLEEESPVTMMNETNAAASEAARQRPTGGKPLSDEWMDRL